MDITQINLGDIIHIFHRKTQNKLLCNIILTFSSYDKS